MLGAPSSGEMQFNGFPILKNSLQKSVSIEPVFWVKIIKFAALILLLVTGNLIKIISGQTLPCEVGNEIISGKQYLINIWITSN